LLTGNPQFVLLTSHTRGVTTVLLESLMSEVMHRGVITSGEMELTGSSDVRPVNSGVWARWTP
ncbi:MAG: hypothetical protein Q7V14_01275, partial [Coriobacteriia bacterium]|nr:hypothetical protein [Coriobacteriia bacterium]